MNWEGVARRLAYRLGEEEMKVAALQEENAMLLAALTTADESKSESEKNLTGERDENR